MYCCKPANKIFTVFSNNSASYGGAIQALDAKINITGNDSFTQNLAEVNGGALALAEGSVVYLIFETASLTFSENIANSFGGYTHMRMYMWLPLFTTDRWRVGEM